MPFILLLDSNIEPNDDYSLETQRRNSVQVTRDSSQNTTSSLKLSDIISSDDINEEKEDSRNNRTSSTLPSFPSVFKDVLSI